TKRIDQLECFIENDSTTKDQQKVGYLRGLENMIRNFVSLYRSRQFSAAHFPRALDVYVEAMNLDKNGASIEKVVTSNSYEVGSLVLASEAFSRNPGFGPSQNSLLYQYCILHPDQIFLKLNQNPDVPFRDTLIRLAGYKYPKRLYDFAAADNRLGIAIRNIDDPFIHAVSTIAKSG